MDVTTNKHFFIISNYYYKTLISFYQKLIECIMTIIGEFVDNLSVTAVVDNLCINRAYIVT